ncbi:MAG TPA: hypothetical protein PLD84_11700 [Chitinophagales bacterium]|nr:hypothetical protein [Chitinophagales bacterium]
MKNLRTIAVCVSITLYSLSSSAQTGDVIPLNEPNLNKPKLFQNLPDNIPVKMENILSLFGVAVGQPVNMSMSDVTPFQFAGNVVSAISKYENSIQSIVVKSTNYPGASLTISKITDANGNVSYRGRILSMQHGDMFELKGDNNQFILVKKKFYDLVNE